MGACPGGVMATKTVCGYHAGHVVFKEFKGKDGIGEYIDWWKQSFEFNKSVAQGEYSQDDNSGSI